MMCDNRLFHDFPRLAKESGFYFNYRSKQVDWSQIEKIDLEDIAKHKRFELLEEKLEFVIGCELDDGITKVLDCNFVKLFRLAQLSVGYLRHCQFYLDRCVILLQEQLTAALKCFECEKTFMSATYLESHQRRRHTTVTSPRKFVSIAVQTDHEVENIPIKKNLEQQTDNLKTVSSECQTSKVTTFDIGLMTNLENQQSETNEIMERFESLYQRIELIEKQTSDQKQTSTSELVTLLQNLLPLHHRTNNGGTELQIQETQKPLINFNNEPEAKMGFSEKVEEAEATLDIFHDESSPSPEISPQSPFEATSSNTFISGSLPKAPITRVRKKVNMSVDEIIPTPIPRPRPRKSTISRQKSLLIDFEDTDSDEDKSNHPIINENNLEERMKTIGDPVFNIGKLEKSSQHEEIATPVISILGQPNVEETQQNVKKDTESILKNDNSKTKPKSLFKTIVKKSSPKLKGFRKTIRKSWSNFSDSKLFTADNMLIRPSILSKNTKLEEDREEDSSSEEIMLPEKDENQKKNKYENKLRELGVDSEWSGIPENSYTRIKAILDQRSQLLAKNNPDYLRRRNRLESLVAQRIRKSDQVNSDNTKPISKSEQAQMYDIESDTESEANNSISPIAKTRNIMGSSINYFPSYISNEKSSVVPIPALKNNDENSPIVEIQTVITASDSSDISDIEKEIKPTVTLKSSILNKGKDEMKKKVVFADNFEIETAHHLMKTPNSSNSSSSSSDWDIPMP